MIQKKADEFILKRARFLKTFTEDYGIKTWSIT